MDTNSNPPSGGVECSVCAALAAAVAARRPSAELQPFDVRPGTRILSVVTYEDALAAITAERTALEVELRAERERAAEAIAKAETLAVSRNEAVDRARIAEERATKAEAALWAAAARGKPRVAESKRWPLCCSFCGSSEQQVKTLIAGPTVYICNECVDLCSDILIEGGHRKSLAPRCVWCDASLGERATVGSPEEAAAKEAAKVHVLACEKAPHREALATESARRATAEAEVQRLRETVEYQDGKLGVYSRWLLYATHLGPCPDCGNEASPRIDSDGHAIDCEYLLDISLLPDIVARAALQPTAPNQENT